MELIDPEFSFVIPSFIMELINKLYTDLDSPVCFSNANALYNEAHSRDPTITRQKVEDYLHQKSTYTKHKERHLRFRRRQTIPAGYFTDFQVDLADFQKLALQ